MPLRIPYRPLLILILGLWLTISGVGQQGLFWAISTPGKADTSWLLGTLHTYPKRVVAVPEVVTEKLAGAKQLYLEIQMDWKMVVQMLTTGTISTEIMPTEDTDWVDADWDSVKAWFLHRNYLDGPTFDRLKSTPAESRLTNMYLAAYGTEQGAVETDLKSFARQRNMPVKGLDRDWSEIMEWYAHYNSLSGGSWNRGPMETLLADGFYELADLFVAYAAQDTVYISQIAEDVVWKDGLNLADWRNHQWMPQLVDLMKQRSFVAVGAAHLYGPHGVVNLLRQAGFTCTPVQANFSGPRLPRFIQRNSRTYRVVE